MELVVGLVALAATLAGIGVSWRRARPSDSGRVSWRVSVEYKKRSTDRQE
jgi:hypothetical protein